jgi:cytochrome c553
MKAFGLRMALRAVLLALALTAPCHAADMGEASEPPQGRDAQGVEAKVVYCKTCHGLSAEGFRGYVTIPRLAGQQPDYIVNQLRALIERRRLNPIMANVAHGISPSTFGALATRFKSLDPPPFGGAPKENIALGRSIFATGLPDDNVPACSACHGPDGKGQRQIPRLAGQLYWYTVKALRNWSVERGQGSVRDISAIMSPTAHNLTPAQVSAIAAYVSNLR